MILKFPPNSFSRNVFTIYKINATKIFAVDYVAIFNNPFQNRKKILTEDLSVKNFK